MKFYFRLYNSPVDGSRFVEFRAGPYLDITDKISVERLLNIKKLMTITEVAQIVGISTKTIMRWEKMGKIKKSKRNWRSWRVYDENDLIQIRQLHEILIEVE